MNNIVKSARSTLRSIVLHGKKSLMGVSLIGEGFYLVYRHQLYKDPNNPSNTRYIQHFLKKVCQAFNIEVELHGTVADVPSLWVSNHISWLDIAVLGAKIRVFFLAKAEIEKWPILGQLAKGGGTLFIKRGSGDSNRIRDQITQFLKQDIPVLFFPEATTTDGSRIRKVHGRLLSAAIEAQRPVQICLICYVNQQGGLDTTVPLIGEVTFVEHVKQTLEMPKIKAHLLILPLIDVKDHTVASLTEEVQNKMQQGLQQLHQKVLKSPDELNTDTV